MFWTIKKTRIDKLLRLPYAQALTPMWANPHTQARSQKFAMGGLFWGSGGGAPSARKFCIFFQKYINFRAILIKNIAFKTWHKNWQRNMIKLAA